MKNIREFMKRCKKGSISLKESEGGTFTMSNLGLKGVGQFTPNVDPTQAAFAGIGEVFDLVATTKSGRYKITKKMILPLTYDIVLLMVLVQQIFLDL